MKDSPLTLKAAKYSKNAEFSDPVVRCDACKTLLFTDDIKEHGMCVCGNRRVRNVMTLKPEEHQMLVEKGVDPAFLALFEGVNRG